MLDLLRRRTSVREFLDKPVPAEVINEILEAGRLSPSGGNEQPWRFGVIRSREINHAISILAGQSWIDSAPLVIALCAVFVSDRDGGRDIQMDRFPGLKNEIGSMNETLYHGINMEEHQTKIAGAHLEMAALEHGLG